MEIPETKYAKTADGVNIAYQVRGDGPIDLVYIVGFSGNFEIEFESAWGARFLERLASFSRVILFDKRGTGLSDRVVRTPDLDMRADDLRAVLDAVGSERAVLFGDSEGGSLAAFFAATHPERVLALALYGSYARFAWAADYPLGLSNEGREEWRTEIKEGWGSIEMARSWVESEAPSHTGDQEWVQWLAKAMRHGASPVAALAFEEVQHETDVRSVLPSVQAPTLVLSRDPADHASSADLAERIPGAKHVQLPGRDHIPYAGNIEVLIDEVQRFVRSVSAEEASFDRVLATVLFTDVVGSTTKATELGDRAWRDLLERHHAIVRAMIGRYRGMEIDTAGDGFLATFDGPARGVACAQTIVEAVQPLGLEIRAGLHTGEVETIGDQVRGIAVHIGARVAAIGFENHGLLSLRERGEAEAAREAFAEAAERWRELGVTSWLARSLALRAEAERRCGARARARRSDAEAQNVLDRLATPARQASALLNPLGA